ncbi:hypothetical protein TeGR_g14470 [Tetraparma gracilis]|uniref:Uncharacterized protein n=1 Tax=Tetraparma gracilis TaxID=2962635 RepID=A0ABQ6MNH7_9STRA|nr:hypothetical protein TeGR_g14470 [Tetraparma gracilis]
MSSSSSSNVGSNVPPAPAVPAPADRSAHAKYGSRAAPAASPASADPTADAAQTHHAASTAALITSSLALSSSLSSSLPSPARLVIASASSTLLPPHLPHPSPRRPEAPADYTATVPASLPTSAPALPSPPLPSFPPPPPPRSTSILRCSPSLASKAYAVAYQLSARGATLRKYAREREAYEGKVEGYTAEVRGMQASLMKKQVIASSL